MQLAKASGKLPPVKFDKSGWMLVRAVTNNPEDVSLRQHRAVLRRDRLPAAGEQGGGPVLPRLGL